MNLGQKVLKLEYLMSMWVMAFPSVIRKLLPTVIPNFVGVDIGCGMLVIEFQ